MKAEMGHFIIVSVLFFISKFKFKDLNLKDR